MIFLKINGKYYTGKNYQKDNKKYPYLTDNKSEAKKYKLGNANNARYNMKFNYSGIETIEVVNED